MEVKVISEHGYAEAAFGLGLSYGKTSGTDFYDYDIDDLARQHSTMVKLAGKGNGHDKFLRMMTVYLDITAPMYWWKEMMTYSVGVVVQSESTMHTLGKKLLTPDMFELQNMSGYKKENDIIKHKYAYLPKENYYKHFKEDVIAPINNLILQWQETKDKEIWQQIVNLLPMSFLQRRIVMCNYAVLQNIIRQRKDHKLAEWNYFIDSIRKQLSHSYFIF